MFALQKQGRHIGLPLQKPVIQSIGNLGNQIDQQICRTPIDLCEIDENPVGVDDLVTVPRERKIRTLGLKDRIPLGFQ